MDSFDASRDGYARSDVSKETIENLITSNIQPRPGPDLFHVSEVEFGGRIVFVVEVAKSLDAAYQAKDLRFYRRSHYKAEAMEQWEILEVMNRSAYPEIIAEVGARNKSPNYGYDSRDRIIITLSILLRNLGQKLAERVAIQFWIPDGYNLRPLPNPLYRGGSPVVINGSMHKTFMYYHMQPLGQFPMFPGTEHDIFDGNDAYMQLYLFKNKEQDARKDCISLEVYADNAPAYKSSILMYELFLPPSS